MYTGEQLGRALSDAIEKKGVKKSDVAREFQIKPPSLTDWIKHGRIGKQHIQKMLEYFSDVVPPSHFGIDGSVFNQTHMGTGDNIHTQNNFLAENSVSGSLKKCVMPDNSFIPVIPQSSELIYDTNDTEVIDGKIYLIQRENMQFIRRVYRQMDGSLKLTCENPTFDTMTVDASRVSIIGRVIRWTVND